MSVQAQVERINQNIADTYSVLESAGAIMPANTNSDNLPSTAQTISAVLYSKSQILTDEQKAQARENIGAAGKSDNSDSLPDYWKTSIDALADTIRDRQADAGAKAFQFAWFSDPHGVADQKTNDTITSRVTDIGRVAQYAAEKFDLPFVAITGDIMSQASHSSDSSVLAEYEAIRELLAPIDRDKLVYGKGNHDGSWCTANGVSYLKNIGSKAIYNAIFRRQALERSRVFGGDGSYFYIDDTASKVRLVMLNGHTDGDGSVDSNGYAVYNSQKNGVYGTEQLTWLANTALDVPEGWGIVIMAHQPIVDSKDGAVLNGILKAYNNKTTYSGSVDVSGDYWGKNVIDTTYKTVTANVNFSSAKGEVIAMFAGHKHQDLVYAAADYGYACPVIVITTAGADVRGNNINYNRVVGTATETAMDIVTVDRLNKKIYCTRLGAGIDRIISYSGATIVTYSITNTLTNCTNSNGISTIEVGKPYSGTIAANSGYVLDSVKVTMGGTDVTSSVYSDGTISIGAVTGNIVITANAVAEAAKTYTVTNTLTKCTNSNSATVIEEKTAYKATISPNTGYNLGTVKVTMGGTDITSTAYSNGSINIASVTGNIVITATATIKTFSVTKNLTNCSISNSASTVNYGSTYSATITAKDGYTLDSVNVTMGGSAVSVINGVINIASVTGNIVITANGVEAGSAYTNLFDKDAAYDPVNNTRWWSNVIEIDIPPTNAPIFHIKGAVPYKFNYRYRDGGWLASDVYCSNANGKKPESDKASYDSTVGLFQHNSGADTFYAVKFMFNGVTRDSVKDSLIITANEEIVD